VVEIYHVVIDNRFYKDIQKVLGEKTDKPIKGKRKTTALTAHQKALKKWRHM
jgi:hypothetical protein